MDYIAHHGVQGQKWGVRRYQNADGSLTNAGKRRYGSQQTFDDYNRYKNVQSLIRKEERRAKFIKGTTKAVITSAVLYSGYRYLKSDKGKATMKKLLQKAAVTAYDSIKESTVNVGKAAVDGINKAATEAKKTVQNTDAAKSYVKTVNQGLNAAKKAESVIRNTSTAKSIRKTDFAKAYVNFIDSGLNKIKGK